MAREALYLQPAAEKRSGSRVGLVVTGVLGGSLVALYAVAAPFLAPALRKVCLPFVPATTAQVENVLGALRARSGTLVDIGSGDGRIVSATLSQPLEPQKILPSTPRQDKHRHRRYVD